MGGGLSGQEVWRIGYSEVKALEDGFDVKACCYSSFKFWQPLGLTGKALLEYQIKMSFITLILEVE